MLFTVSDQPHTQDETNPAMKHLLLSSNADGLHDGKPYT